MSSRALTPRRYSSKASLPVELKHSGDYFSATEKSEVKSPAFAYSLAGVRTFAEGEDTPSSPAQRILKPLSSSIQAKLVVGAANDPLEQEAERFAELVLGMREPATGASTGEKPGAGWASASGGRSNLTGLQRKCACGGSCEACKAEQKHEEHGGVQRKPAAAVPEHSLGPSMAPPIVDQVVRSPGQPLDSATRAIMEPRFGWNFSQVRIHSDRTAQQSARELNARAYTVGKNVVFAENQFSPATNAGRSLLAHELTHVVQQSGRGPDGVMVQRVPWGPCPKGPRVSALGQKFIYVPAELFARAEFLGQNVGQCLLTSEMIAGNIFPTCGPTDQPLVEAIKHQFHEEKTVKRNPVLPTRNVTGRPEAEKAQKAIEAVHALLQPDFVNVTKREVYDVTTKGQRSPKKHKIAGYVRLLSQITHQPWTAGRTLIPFVPLTFPIKPTKIEVCFGPTDFSVWPGVIQYEPIDTGRKGKKKTEKEEKKKKGKEEKEEKGEKKKKGDPTKGGNIGFGIGILSSGGGKGNVGFGVSILSHGHSYGTVSAGVVYDSNGTAIGTVTAGAAAQSSGTMVVGAAAGGAKGTSGESAVTASAGTASETSGEGAVAATAGKSEETSGATVVGAARGESKGQSGVVVGKKGEATSAEESGETGGGAPGGGEKTATQGEPKGGQGTGLEIPGVSEADAQKAVGEAGNIDAILQKATPAQRSLMNRLAQLSGDKQYAVPSADWVKRVFSVTQGLSEADIARVEQLNWHPGNVSEEELRKKVQEALKHGPSDQVEGAPEGDLGESEQSGPNQTKDKPADKPEDVKAQIARLQKRAKAFNASKLRLDSGELDWGKEKVYDKPVSVAMFFKTKIHGRVTLVTADVSGTLKHVGKIDRFTISGASLLVSPEGTSFPAGYFIGKTYDFPR